MNGDENKSKKYWKRGELMPHSIPKVKNAKSSMKRFD
jgi:hypothetical protein